MSIWTRNLATLDRGDNFLSVQDYNNIIPDGGVRIKADKWTDLIWHGGEITTLGAWSFQYGYAEVMAKLPAGQGLISAFYLFEPESQNEIDVFECIDPTAQNLQLTVHQNKTQENTEYIGEMDLSADWHLYGVDWTDKYIKWYLDKREIWMQIERVPQVPLSIYLCLNVGGWPGLPDETTPDPSFFDIAYLKVWQRA